MVCTFAATCLLHLSVDGLSGRKVVVVLVVALLLLLLLVT